MADVFNRKKRSDVMSKIRSAGNRDTELVLISLMRQNRITGWRRGQLLAGKPDFVFRTHKLAVFVDGCFWHGCPKCYRQPTSNIKYRKNKIKRNREHVKFVSHTLRRQGWRVIRIWECALNKNTASCIRRIRKALSK